MIEELAPGLISSRVDGKYLPELREDLESNNEVLGLIHDEESEEVSVIISIAEYKPELRYVH